MRDVSYAIYHTVSILMPYVTYTIFDSCLMALNEGHRLRNETTIQTQDARRLHAAFKVILTGTPVQNSAHELWWVRFCTVETRYEQLTMHLPLNLTISNHYARYNHNYNHYMHTTHVSMDFFLYLNDFLCISCIHYRVLLDLLLPNTLQQSFFDEMFDNSTGRFDREGLSAAGDFLRLIMIWRMKVCM